MTRNSVRQAAAIAAAAGLVLLTGCVFLDGLASSDRPAAALCATPTTGRAPLLVQLNAGTSQAQIGIASHDWSFGDGTDSQTTSTSTVEHTYDRSGIYVARVTVTDTSGRTSSASAEIIIENTPPRPSCRFSNDAPVVGETVQFDASGSSDPDGDLVGVRWDFGDGTTAQGIRVTHIYSEPAVCLVHLEIEDNGGAVSTLSHTMTIHLGTGGESCSGGGVPIWL